MLKRVADWLEKISAGSMLIGLYQGNNYAVLFGFFTNGVIFAAGVAAGFINANQVAG